MKDFNVFLKIYNILNFLDFLYLLQVLQCMLIYLYSIENILISFCESFYIHFEKTNLYTLINFYLLK